jgi:hypothetical protein
MDAMFSTVLLSCMTADTARRAVPALLPDTLE